MKVLVLDEWIPYPLVSGKRLRSYHLLTRAARSHEITYLCFADLDGEEKARSHMESLGIRLVTLAQRNPFVPHYRLYGLTIANLLYSMPLVMRKHFRNDYLDTLTQLLERESFDLIHCEWTHYGIYVSELANYPLFLSSHNIEAMPWQRLYAHERNPAKKILLYLEWRKMLRFEKQICRQFHHIGAVSEDDLHKFRDLYGCESVAVIPNGIDVSYYKFALPEPRGKTLVFSASFDAFVNQDAVVYFVKSIYPKILEKDPEVRVVFLGKDPPLSLRRYTSESITFSGTVEDVRPHLSQCSVCVVPVRVAGGSRIKILEAMACGLPVVSTPQGAEGLEVKAGEHLLVGQNEEEFAGLVLDLLNDRSLVQSLCTKARKLVEERYDWEKIAPLLEKAWNKTIVRFSHGQGRGSLLSSCHSL